MGEIGAVTFDFELGEGGTGGFIEILGEVIPAVARLRVSDYRFLDGGKFFGELTIQKLFVM